MKVLIDGTKLSSDVASGISNYISNILRCFKIHEAEYVIDTKVLIHGERHKKNVHLSAAKIPHSEFINYNSWELLKLILIKPRDEIALFHSPYMFLPPKSKHCTNVLTVHDTINLERPLTFRNKLREWALRLAIARADYLICISNATKDSLKRHYPTLKNENIFVIPQGIDNIFLTGDLTETTYELPKNYLLYVGKRDGYKNFPSLLSFFANELCPSTLTLVCVGGGDFTSEEKTLIHRLNLEPRIQHVGFINDVELKSIYKNALALVYTSLKEGFGLPILEAMACKCPVICGNFSSMKEVANGNAILLNDFSPKSLSFALNKLKMISEEQLENFKAYAIRMSWENTAIQTLRIYSKILNLRNKSSYTQK